MRTATRRRARTHRAGTRRRSARLHGRPRRTRHRTVGESGHVSAAGRRRKHLPGESLARPTRRFARLHRRRRVAASLRRRQADAAAHQQSEEGAGPRADGPRAHHAGETRARRRRDAIVATSTRSASGDTSSTSRTCPRTGSESFAAKRHSDPFYGHAPAQSAPLRSASPPRETPRWSPARALPTGRAPDRPATCRRASRRGSPDRARASRAPHTPFACLPIDPSRCTCRLRSICASVAKLAW